MQVRKWKQGFRPRVTADIAGAEFDRIKQQEGGMITAPAVVDAATPDDAPLHPAFQWDNEAAGHEYRLIQARTMIRALIVVPEARPAHREYINVRPPTPEEEDELRERNARVYRPMEEVVKDPNPRDLHSALAMLTAKLTAAETAVREVEVLAGEEKKGALAGILVALETARGLAATLR